ncbi:MAG: Ig domain-containing protein [Bacteroidales bacterium]|nr:Ig domain-containing protein [Bacteroidales bacterium]
MTGSVGGEPDWNNNSYIDVYLSDGAKYTVSGLECMDGDGYLRYHGYDAATDGHGTVSVTNGSAAVTDGSIGYRTTTYTFTATPASGYRFVNWTKGAGGEELGTDASIDVTCQQNGRYQVYANFAQVPVPITVRMAAGTEDAANWSIASGNVSVPGTQVLENVMSGSEVTATYNGTTRKVKSVKAVKYVPPVLVESIVLDKQTAFLGVDSTMTLTASVLPENAADKSYTWSSDATAVAWVNENGVVTGYNPGTANIIATANDGSGVKDTCVVTVLSPVILDGVTVLYASDNDTWSTIIGYNPGVLYHDGNNVRLTSNGAFLYFDGHQVLVDDFIHPVVLEYYQWLRKAEISGSEFYYHQGETWQQAISADRMYNEQWSINDGKVIYMGDWILVDDNWEPVAPTATIDPSTVDYYFDF